MKRKRYAEVFNIDTIVKSLSSELNGKFKKPVLIQNRTIYFNLFNGIELDKIKEMTQANLFIKNIYIFCNQYSIVLEVDLIENNDTNSNKKLYNNDDLNLASILSLDKKFEFFAPKARNEYINEQNYAKLNDILKLVLFVLYNEGIVVKKSEYKSKNPFLIISIELRQKFDTAALSKIQKCSKCIKNISVKFDVKNKVIKINLKINFF
jgi:hypothetical protein